MYYSSERICFNDAAVLQMCDELVGIAYIFYLYIVTEVLTVSSLCCLAVRCDKALFTLQRDTACRDYGMHSFEYGCLTCDIRIFIIREIKAQNVCLF